MNWYLTVLKKYATFSGRARRKEYWMYTLFNILVIAVLATLTAVTQVEALMYVYLAYVLATLLPSIAVVVRRLHDTGKSGAYYFVVLIPLAGAIWLLVLMASEGNKDSNAYGPDPKLA